MSMVRQRVRPRRRQQSVAAVVLTAMLCAIAAAPFWAVAPRAMAAGTPTYLHLSPTSATYATGATVSIHAAVYDDDGNLSTGTSTHVRFYFWPASPNDPGSPGSSPDMDCDTGTDGTCDVTYVANPHRHGHDLCVVLRWSVRVRRTSRYRDR